MAREHVDVLIVGAGLSGIGAGYHIQTNCPDKSYAILEGRSSIGGTWDLFRYPGIRSDSDMYTLGYSFRPWKEAKAIADGPSILNYVKETASAYGIDNHIRFNHQVKNARWSSRDAQWTIVAERSDTGQPIELSCDFLFMCSGYYNYDHGYTPEFAGTERFRGMIIHPQKWPENLDYAGKRVIVIGSGATAVTLVPAMAEKASHVTMLQRSPTYIMSLPDQDVIANALRKVLPAHLAYSMTRWKNVAMSMFFYQLSRRRPELVKKLLRKQMRKELGPDFDIDRHFKPEYNPWDQRLCLVPNADLFRALRKGHASVVTDHIETFTETGIQLKSGETLEADIIVTATGLDLVALGGLDLEVDGKPVELGKTMSYKGMMLSGVPNMAFAVGYTNASWTLKCDLTCEYVCRLLNFMDRHGHHKCMPQALDPTIDEAPLIDLASTYVLRAIDRFPKQGSKAPWRLYQNYVLDLLKLRYGSLDDSGMTFDQPPVSTDKPAESLAR